MYFHTLFHLDVIPKLQITLLEQPYQTDPNTLVLRKRFDLVDLLKTKYYSLSPILLDLLNFYFFLFFIGISFKL